MSRYDEKTNAHIPERVTNPEDQQGFRHWGDGIAGKHVAARVQGYDPVGLGYVDVQVDANGVVQTSAGGGGGAVTVADGADVAQGALADAAIITDAAGSLSGKLRGLVKWAFERMPASLGQKTMAASLPVVVASDQSAIPVSGPLTDTQLRATAVPVSAASLPLPTGATTEATLAAIKTAVELLDNIVAGTEAQVDIVASLPAGTNNIGDVDVLTLPALPAGTNNIGDVDVLTLPALSAGTNAIGKLAANSGVDIGDVDVTSQPARDRLTDNVGVALQTDVILSDTTALTPKFAKANIAASTTDGAVITAVASKKLRVLIFRIHAGGTATNATFNSKPAGAGTAISELFACGANGGHHGAFSPIGHFETVAGEGLTVTTGAGSTVGIGVVYVEV